MIARIEILMDILFGQCVDQTLFDARAKAGRGEPVDDGFALSDAERDIFEINLKTVCDRVLVSSWRKILGMELRDGVITADVEVPDDYNPEITASGLKDLLKAGMLAWWYEGKDAGLYGLNTEKYDSHLSTLRITLAGRKVSRGYSYY